LWKNKANNFKRYSATSKPEHLQNYKNYNSPERNTNLIQKNNNKETLNSSSICNQYLNKQNQIEINPIVFNKKEIIDRSITDHVNRDTPQKTINNNYLLISPIKNSANKSPTNKSAISDDNVSQYDDRNPRLNSKKVNNRKIVVSDIDSDIDGFSQK
jgi:hypothetical protein